MNDKRVNFVCTQAEFDNWGKCADLVDRSLSSWIRETCNRRAENVSATRCPDPLRNTVEKIGNFHCPENLARQMEQISKHQSEESFFDFMGWRSKPKRIWWNPFTWGAK